MCLCIPRTLLFVLTFPFLLIFLIPYIIVVLLYMVFIKLPCFYCCSCCKSDNDDEYYDASNNNYGNRNDHGDNNNNNSDEVCLSPLAYAIPPNATPMGTMHEFVHILSRTKCAHYYMYYVFGNRIAKKLVQIRRRFENGEHTDVFTNKEYCRVFGGNQLPVFDKLIVKVENFNPHLNANPSQKRLYIPPPSEQKENQPGNQSQNMLEITFTELDSLSAAIVEWHSSQSKFIAILDLASRRHVGGLGYCFYAGTQEEDLIRMSNLYYLLNPSMNEDLQLLLTEADVFDTHIPYFGCTYIPNVTFLSGVNCDDNDKRLVDSNETLSTQYNINKNLEYTFNVVCSAAVDMREHSNEFRSFFRKASADQLRGVMKRKIEAQLASAILTKNSTLICGAFGCGAYNCDTAMVAQCYKEVLNSGRYQNKGLKKIVFAIAYDNKKLEQFRNIILQQE